MKWIAVALWVATTSLVAQSVSFDGAKISFFPYPPLARIARIRGKVDMILSVDKGRVVSVRPVSGVKEFPIPQLSLPAIEVAKRIEFHPSMSGEIDIHLAYKITDLPRGKTRVEFDHQSHEFTIECGQLTIDDQNATIK